MRFEAQNAGLVSSDADSSDWTSIRIESPLPSNVAGALMNLIGSAWPEAVIETAGHGYALNFRVPKQPPENLDETFAQEIRRQADANADDTEFLGFEDGWVAFAPPEELCLHLGSVAHGIFTAHQPAAINHVEWVVTTGKEPDDPSYVLSVSVAKDKTPLAMRQEAEAEVERLKAILDKEGISY